MISIIVAMLLSSVVVDARRDTPGYRRRHLTSYQEVCFPTAAPVPAPIPAPVMAPVPAPAAAPVTSPISAPVQAPVWKPSRGKGGTVVGGPTSKSGPVYSPPKSNPGYNPSPPKRSPTTKSGYVYAPPSPPRSSTTKSGIVYTPPSPPRSSTTKSGTIYTPPSPPRGSTTKSGTVYSPPSPGKWGRALSQPAVNQRALQVISLNTTFAPFGGYSLSGSFSGSAVLTWPNYCFFATLSISNFIPNCVGCSFVVTNGSHTCDASAIPVVTPFIDPTEITFDPYTNSTFFDTDSTGNAVVSDSNLCTGTGPQDNYQRPLLLLDPSGQIAACGILSYVCP